MYTSNIIVKQGNTNSSSFWVPVFECDVCPLKSYTADLLGHHIHDVTFRAVRSLGVPWWIYIGFRDKKCLLSFRSGYRASARQGGFNNYTMLKTKHIFIRMNGWGERRRRVFWRVPISQGFRSSNNSSNAL